MSGKFKSVLSRFGVGGDVATGDLRTKLQSAYSTVANSELRRKAVSADRIQRLRDGGLSDSASGDTTRMRSVYRRPIEDEVSVTGSVRRYYVVGRTNTTIQ